jgi:tetratricopeptide (TPR) repeat protein
LRAGKADCPSQLLSYQNHIEIMPTPNYQNIINGLHHKADQLYQSGQCDAAVDLLLSAIKEYPNEKSVYHALSEMLIDSEQYQDALDILTQMPTGQADQRRLILSGYCKLGLGLFEEADAIADKVLSQDEDSALALNLKGALACKREDRDIAAEFFDKAIAANPEYGDPYSHLGTLCWEASRFAEALDFFEKGFMRAPTVSKMVRNYHLALKDQGAYERAERVFRQALERNPLNKRLMYLFIEILLQQSKSDLAMREIERAIAAFGIEDGILPVALKIRGELGPLQIDKKSNETTSVSLCMIAKNEEEYLAKCLWSVKPVVDEIIVVDTGSQDRTRDIAAVFGANVFEYQWNDDFSKARNFSLSKASGDWIFMLDADEVISARDHKAFRRLVNNRNGDPVAYTIVTRNYTMQANTIGWVANDGTDPESEAGSGWFPSQKVRLFKNDARIRFEYPVHEMVDPGLDRLGMPIQKCAIPVHHYGKLNTGISNRKTETYYTIGTKKLSELGNNFGAIRELAIQAGHLAKHEEAIELWQRFIAQKPDDPEAYLNMGTAHWNLGHYDQAVAAAQKAIALAPAMKEAHFNYAISELHLGNAPKAIPVLENTLKQNPRYLSAEFMLAAAYCCAGRQKKALAGFEKIRLTAVGSVLAVSFYDLAKRLNSANQARYAMALLEMASKKGFADDALIDLMDNISQAN